MQVCFFGVAISTIFAIFSLYIFALYIFAMISFPFSLFSSFAILSGDRGKISGDILGEENFSALCGHVGLLCIDVCHFQQISESNIKSTRLKRTIQKSKIRYWKLC